MKDRIQRMGEEGVEKERSVSSEHQSPSRVSDRLEMFPRCHYFCFLGDDSFLSMVSVFACVSYSPTRRLKS